ncbi:MAG: hypothetical protein M3315_04755 [Actinomycetota bacterium]|nr:hypothetical protein [Actinomycetota bacterium]
MDNEASGRPALFVYREWILPHRFPHIGQPAEVFRREGDDVCVGTNADEVQQLGDWEDDVGTGHG